MGSGTVKKKLKRVTDVLTSKRVQKPATAAPSTPTKKDTRGWQWHTPRRPQGRADCGHSQPLPALIGFLAAALSPRPKASAPATSRSQPASSPGHPPLSEVAPCCDFVAPSVPLAASVPTPSDHTPTETTTLDTSPDHQPTVQDGDADSIDSRLDDDDVDDQDGVHGNYHHPSTRCHKFLDFGYAILARDLLDERETPPLGDACPVCHATVASKAQNRRTLYYCEDCFTPVRKCIDCILTSHREHPFHRIHSWVAEKGCWLRVKLGDIGYQMALHHGGYRCPSATSEGRDIVVVHEHGIESVPVVYCACMDAPPDPSQLMEAGLWPATWEKPRSAITLAALKTFHSLSHNAHTNAHDFVAHLERLSDGVITVDVKDRVREFRIAIRTYGFVRACRRAGVDPCSDLPIGCLAVTCPACPQPGHNMRPGWEGRDEEFAHMDALHFCIDGNFHFNLKPKHTDPKDFPLTKGAAYFAHEDDFKAYIATTKPYPNEPSKCSQFVAMGAGKYKGPVSGIIALVCRHNFVLQGGIVDLTKGEKFLYTDFAFVSAMQRYRDLRMMVMMYDIACQYVVKLPRRIEDQFSPEKVKDFKSIDSARLPEKFVAGIGKYHEPMHTAECRPFNSLHKLPGVGDDFGENAEQKWAQIEGATAATKEMSAGHRHDIMNDLNSDENAQLVHGMVDHLCDKHEVAERRLEDAKTYLESVEKSIDDSELVSIWQKELAQWEVDVVDPKNHAHMSNPFEIASEASLTTKMIVNQLHDEHERDGNRYGVATVSAMEAALHLDNRRLALLRKINSCDGTDKDSKAIGAKLEHYRRDARICQDECHILLVPAVAKAVMDAQTSCQVLPPTFPRRIPSDDLAEKIAPFTDKPPSHEVAQGGKKRKCLSRAQKALQAMAAELQEPAILLPSAYHRLIRDHVGMKVAVATERKLREGLAAEALDRLRLHLTTYKALQLRKTQVSGVINNTNVDQRIAEKREATDRAKYEYRKNRHLLRILGMPEDDAKFKPLKDSDCSAFVITDAERQRGDSHRLPSWIWGDFSYVLQVRNGDIRQFLDDSLKAHWFRHGALVGRWKEAVRTRREEMYRTLRSYRRDRAKWLTRADDREKVGRLGSAAYARRQAYRYQRLAARAETKFPDVIYEAVGIPANKRIDPAG
ncbi:hypothetical protein DICSQDRAFT_184244 [Dichomitus squalens LYAD-421 SS1]|uniref:CxC2-like cysteine cluster KDZ transposase-associated domain-containing protein n=2 Tax=Dichomitus squalens TaxID=114155 RepID=R7SJ16_DICSQ|nr:uncharacterized protein DICSQDRAFT_184244 [Dichomitus squalens LYAD-421 SS1]EJF55675.1 hypothetical protein DICSQDRAFT_184244 [Dichomitus squalens LYAD-421 SS1]